MNESLEKECPRTEALSALMDGELTERERADITAHARLCPVCGAMVEDLDRLREALQPLAHTRLERDLSPLIDARLSAASARPPMAARPRRPRYGWQLAPAGLVAAAVFGVGVSLGALLAGGATAVPSRPAAMAVFDAVPPGGLCVGAASCFPGPR